MTRRIRRSGVMVAILGLALGAALAAPGEAVVPTQFIAKMYSEALGRIPDQGGWGASVDYYEAAGCSQSTLKTHGSSIYLSVEYNGLGYDDAAKLLTLYRGVLNREPDPGGFNYWLGELSSGASWSSVVRAFFDSSEFSGLVADICNASVATYWFGTAPAIDLPVTGGGFQGTEAELRALLRSTPPGGTVWLAQKAVVRLTATLDIPAGVTLTTTGAPSHNRYALMGRLVRASNFGSPAVQLFSGAKLLNVWVDGQRGEPTHYNHNAINVLLLGGTGTTVSGCRISNTAGWSSLQAFGTFENWPCASSTVSGNLVTVYSSEHYPIGGQGYWADGLSIACENTTVENNQIIDPTDVAIVVFRASPAVQRSVVRNNLILNAGNSAYGAMGFDPLMDPEDLRDFTGASITGNTLWTGRAHYDIALYVGTRAWFGTQSAAGLGASATNNSTGTQSIWANTGIGVSGMYETTVQGNAFTTYLIDVSACPTVHVGASVSAGYASGNIQPYTDVLIEGCIGH